MSNTLVYQSNDKVLKMNQRNVFATDRDSYRKTQLIKMQRTNSHVILSLNKYPYNTIPTPKARGIWQRKEPRRRTFVVRLYVLEMPGKLQPGSLKNKAAQKDQNKNDTNKHANMKRKFDKAPNLDKKLEGY